MEEANEWSEELGLASRYRLHKRPGGSGEACHVYENGDFAKEVTFELFEKRYRTLQSRWVQLSVAKEKRDRAAPPPLLSGEEQENLQREIRRVTLATFALSERMR